MDKWQAFTKWLESRQNASHHRQLLVIDMAIEEAIAYLQKICSQFAHTTLMSNSLCIDNTRSIPMSRYQDYLGTQTNALIFDAHNGFHLNSFYAGAGMVKVNGLVVVLLAPDCQYHHPIQNFAFSYAHMPKQSFFMPLFLSQSLQYGSAYIGKSDYQLPSFRVLKKHYLMQYSLTHLQEDAHAPLDLTVDQLNIANNIVEGIQTAPKNTPTSACILGARGRGKSTLLAHIGSMLNALVDNNRPVPVVVTALNQNQLHSFTDYTLTKVQHRSHAARPIGAVADQVIVPFYAPDEIIERAPANAIVLIDEVASIAPDLIKKIVLHFTHCVMTGTASGYEGSGKGLLKRLLPAIETSRSLQSYCLLTPFRWPTCDPIESLLDSLLCAQSAPLPLHKPVVSSESTNTVDIKHSVVNKQILVENHHLYEQIFTLLNEAHYQTTPNDIVRTLDAPDCVIVIAHKQDQCNERTVVLAVAIVINEGGKVLTTLASDISLGKRRVQGHLSPQSLAMYFTEPRVCTYRYLRINRIAVIDSYKRRAIGSNLLAYCEQYARAQGFDYLSTSFGYAPHVFAFWQSNSFCLVKLGHRIDSASASVSVLMLKRVAIEPLIDCQLITFRLALEKNFLSKTNTCIANAYGELFNSLPANPNANTTVISEFVARSLQYYLAGNLSLSKVSSLLYWWVYTQSFAEPSHKDSRTVRELLLSLETKGVHKHHKSEMENAIMALVKAHYRPSPTLGKN